MYKMANNREAIDMNIKDAVEYCKYHRAVIQTPTFDEYIRLLTYLGIENTDRFCNDACVYILGDKCIDTDSTTYARLDDFEIINLIPRHTVSINGIYYKDINKAIAVTMESIKEDI